MTEVEIAWLAGLIEGEGCIGRYEYPRSNGRRYRKTLLQVEMKDLDVINKLRTITGYGNINFKKARGQSKETWVWTVTNREHVKILCSQILPHMGERRSQRIAEILSL